ncbi:MAG: Gfo/Idh/MocA family oxidoreductase [Anaerolineae bacterium]|nr:Gfo/Idh/MocA family oxidoreductase [Anaerolineae bacterium]
MDEVRVGVVGAGIMGRLHSRIVSEHPRARMVGVCDTNRIRADELAAQHSVPACTDIADLLAMPLDAVIVAVPDFAHFQPVMAALEAGKHVLVEKPLTTDVAEGEKIAAKVAETGLIFSVNYSNRWISAYAQAKQAIDSGQVGDILWAYARKNDTISVATDMLSWSAASSPAWFLSSHDIDYVRWCMGCEAVEVFATGQRRVLSALGIDTYDGIQALVRFETGAGAIFESGWVYPNSFPTTVDSMIELVGSDGVIHMDRTRETLSVAHAKGYQYPKSSMTLEVAGRLEGALPTSVGQYLDAVLQGRQPAVTVQDGLEVTRIVAAIHQSLESGRPAKITR